MSTENALMNKAVEFQVNGEPVRLTGGTVRNYLVKGNGNVSDQEVVMFINLCKFQKLNPFLNEAYLIKFNGQPAQIIVSKEAFMKRAEKHDQFDGFEAGIIVERDGKLEEIEGAVKLKDDTLIGGWCKVHRKDREHPASVRISYDEFSKGQATWKQMPLNMIRKTAIVNALREAFPESLGAMYTEEETADAPQRKPVQQEIDRHANAEIIDIEPEPAPEEENEQQPEPQPEQQPAGQQNNTEVPF